MSRSWGWASARRLAVLGCVVLAAPGAGWARGAGDTTKAAIEPAPPAKAAGPALDFAAAERLAVAWGIARRASADRSVAGTAILPSLRFSSDDDPIEASLYSLPSSSFHAEAAGRLLAAVHAAAPRRRLVVFADLPQRLALQALVARWERAPASDPAAAAGATPAAGAPPVTLLDTWGRAYSPWPRDPLSLAWSGDRLVVVDRPNLQPGREEDAHFGQALIDMLPPDLDGAWGGAGGVRWTVAPVPFHNGQVLMTSEAAWISLHTLEPRILEILGVDRVPVASFASPAGVAAYAGAARRAARELEGLYGRPVRFVHPLPAGAAARADPSAPSDRSEPSDLSDGAEGSALMLRLGGGAGYDLDSLLTLLPAAGSPVALVASVAAGARLLSTASAAELQGMAAEYGLTDSGGGGLRAALAAAAAEQRPRALDAFLDLVASHLAAQGFTVRRLPLLPVPTALLAGRHLRFPEFLIGWNNVVLERLPGGGRRAEGFSALLPSGDAMARQAFAEAGYHLDLLPPLVESVIFGGGYRCASNQLRRPRPN